MQQLFLDFRSPSFLPPARAILRRLASLAETFESAGRPVFYTVHAHDDPGRDAGLMSVWWRHVCLADSPQARLSPILKPREGRVFQKTRYSAFTNERLAPELRRAGISSLVLCGVATNLCVESTARDAFDLDFKTFVVLDATAARSEDLHLGALKGLAHGFSTLMAAEEVAQRLEALKAP